MGPTDDLRMLARYHRDRLALYRARAFSGRPTSGTRMRELERAAQAADERVRRAVADRGPGGVSSG